MGEENNGGIRSSYKVNGFEATFDILVVSDLGSASKRFDKKKTFGLYYYLNEIEKKPNLFVIIGGVIPEIPIKGRSRATDKLRLLAEGVTNVDDAAAVAKPHLKRIIDAMPHDSEIIYVMDSSDNRNIEYLNEEFTYEYDSLVSDIKKGRKSIIDNRIETLNEEIKERIEIINTTKANKHSIEKRLQKINGNGNNAEKQKRLMELENIKLKLHINREELSELREKRRLLMLLHRQAEKATQKEVIKNEIAKAEQRLKEVREQIENNNVSKEEYDALTKEAKRLSNRLRRLGRRLDEAVEEEANSQTAAKMRQVNRYTGNFLIEKYISELTMELAKLYYISAIKDAFGRRTILNVQSDAINSYSRNGLNIVLMNSSNYRSSAWYNNEADRVGESIFYMMNNLGKWGDLHGPKVNISISGGAANTHFSVAPVENNSDMLVYRLTQGTFASPRYTAEQLSSNRKTDRTKPAAETLFSSNASMLRVGKNSVTHVDIKEKELIDAFERHKKEEAKVLDEVVKKAKAEGSLNEVPTDISINPMLQKAIIRQKLPSEIKSEEIPYLDLEILNEKKEMFGNGEPAKSSSKTSMAVIGDVHVGNYGDLDLLKAAVNDALNRKPKVLVLAGDNIEGNYRDYKYVPREGMSQAEVDEYASELSSKGMSAEEINERISRIERRMNESTIHNVQDQAKTFVGIIAPLVADIIMRGGVVVVVSGNHHNNTSPGYLHDEAKEISDRIENVLNGVELASKGQLPKDWRRHIITIPGGSLGSSGSIEVDDIKIMARHEFPKSVSSQIKFIAQKRVDADIIISGDLHKSENTDAGIVWAMRTPSMQDSITNPFVKVINESASNATNGYAYIEVEKKDGSISKIEHTPVLINGLMNEFKELRRKEEIWNDFVRWSQHRPQHVAGIN